MIKSLILALGAMSVFAAPSFAQGWSDAPGAYVGGGWQDSGVASGGNAAYGHASQGSVGQRRSSRTNSVNYYQPQQTGIAANVAFQAQRTISQALGTAAVANGAPISIMGQSTGWAPGNLALMVEHHSPIGGMLPKTTLDSFVAQSGYNDQIYGDEGIESKPPYSDFSTIGSGGVSATTGHQSDAPSAWGYPQ